MDNAPQLPDLETVKAFYLTWFEANYGVKPAANSTPAASFALAAMEHFKECG